MRDRKDDQTHRRVAERKLGRKLLPHEIADHADGDKENNSPGNIRPMTRSAHSSMHATQGPGLPKLRQSLRMVRERKKLY